MGQCCSAPSPTKDGDDFTFDSQFSTISEPDTTEKQGIAVTSPAKGGRNHGADSGSAEQLTVGNLESQDPGLQKGCSDEEPALNLSTEKPQHGSLPALQISVDRDAPADVSHVDIAVEGHALPAPGDAVDGHALPAPEDAVRAVGPGSPLKQVSVDETSDLAVDPAVSPDSDKPEEPEEVASPATPSPASPPGTPADAESVTKEEPTDEGRNEVLDAARNDEAAAENLSPSSSSVSFEEHEAVAVLDNAPESAAEDPSEGGATVKSADAQKSDSESEDKEASAVVLGSSDEGTAPESAELDAGVLDATEESDSVPKDSGEAEGQETTEEQATDEGADGIAEPSPSAEAPGDVSTVQDGIVTATEGDTAEVLEESEDSEIGATELTETQEEEVETAATAAEASEEPVQKVDPQLATEQEGQAQGGAEEEEEEDLKNISVLEGGRRKTVFMPSSPAVNAVGEVSEEEASPAEEDGPAERITGTWYGRAASGALNADGENEADEDEGSKQESLHKRGLPLIIYVTSVRAVRKTYEQCVTLRSIFLNFGVELDERDISMSVQYRQELKEHMGTPVPVPRVFFGDNYLGGYEDIMLMNETGDLKLKLEEGGYCLGRAATTSCDVCANVKFVICRLCKGSRKIVDEDGTLYRCPDCNENGLAKCPQCFPEAYEEDSEEEEEEEEEGA
ncbi:hypothetical protein CYMTET_6555 [Cymbomonas tetramitiformis]|uniref:Glutaredoxin domain-containing protein n=1 Tax=Cymbomonas tetramitiformis TaxID=36881 RepID=A0AAE0GX71_9CHLO|nr:hypothetical protein CYMTET_6555 [Cymbomonas tetramitiformis]|eukprot:gene23411-28341_t